MIFIKHLLSRLLPDTHPLRLAYHRSRGWIAALWYGFPASKLTVIGITGTDGKTTTVAMVTHILLSQGIRTGAASTAFFCIDGTYESNPTQKTSVSPFLLQKFLRRIVNAGCTHAVLECSSHGLLQGRLNGISFDIAAVTNTSAEHLDYHGSMEEYIQAKALLFQKLKALGVKVLNSSDASFETFSKVPSKQTISYNPESINVTRSSIDQISGQGILDGTPVDLQLSLAGAFNLKNALCAIACAKALDIKIHDAAKALRNFHGTPGRMESIHCGQPFSIFIDFTVTPQAYEATLSTARSMLQENGRLLVLAGSCGDRMKEKRPVVGALCVKLADITVITNEDPYTEDPETIIDAVIAGAKDSVPTFMNVQNLPAILPTKFCIKIPDRREAIRWLLGIAKSGDVILFCGKGADITMMIGTEQIPWNEREIIEQELSKLGYEGRGE